MPNNTVTVQVSPNLVACNQNSAYVASLVGLAPTSSILVSLPVPALQQNAPVQVVSAVTNASAVIDAGFGGLVRFNASASATYLMGAVRATFVRPGLPGGVIVNETWGVAYRFSLKAWKLKTTTSVTLQSIAADCTINGAGSVFQASVCGMMPSALLQEVPGLSMVMGPFDMDKLQELGVIQSQLNRYIQSHPGDLRLQLMAVEVDLAQVTAPYSNSPSTLLGLSGVQYGKTNTEAWDKRPSNDELPDSLEMDEVMVNEMYSALGIADGTDPNQSQKKLGAKSTFRNE